MFESSFNLLGLDYSTYLVFKSSLESCYEIILKELKQMQVCQVLRWEMGMTAVGYRVSFGGGHKNVLELGSNEECTTLNLQETTELYSLI